MREKYYFSNQYMCVAQLVSVLPSVLEVPSSILSDSNICSDFSLICVAVAVATQIRNLYLVYNCYYGTSYILFLLL